MDSGKNRPVGIYIENSENVTLENNTGIGDMNFIVAKNSKNIKGSGNKHISLNNEIAPPNKQWFEKPLGIVILGMVVAIASAGIVFYIGWS